MDNILIILTCTVNINPVKLWLFQTDPNERLKCYLKSIIQWLEKTNLTICVVENSGYTFPELSEYVEKYKHRFEIISYIESELSLEIRSKLGHRSKGGSEIYAINHAYHNSTFKNTTKFVIKITCRYFIEEFEQFLIDSKLSYKSKSGVGIFDTDHILVLRQHDNARCEIIGSHITTFTLIFDLIMHDSNNHYNQHIEAAYINRTNFFNEKNVLTCKQFNIEPTQMGGLNCLVTEL